MTTTAELKFEPARPSMGVAVGAGALAALLAGIAGLVALVPAILGCMSLVAGLLRRSRTVITLGLGVLWLAVVVAALDGLPVEAVGVALVAVVVAWDAADRGLTLGRQLTTRASTVRIEGLHALATFTIGLGSFGGTYVLQWVVSSMDTPMTVIGFALALGIIVYAIEN